VKAALTAILIWTSLLLPGSGQTPIAEAMKNWRTVRVLLVIDMGDYVVRRFILLERVDAERVALSSGEKDPPPESPAVARGMITNATAQALIDRALAFYARAQKETGERALPAAERTAANTGFGTNAFYIRIEIGGEKASYNYEDDFADGGAAVKEFADFILHASK
jgi:hypothetical protein